MGGDGGQEGGGDLLEGNKGADNSVTPMPYFVPV